jgi:hypothetical protein
MESKLGPLGTSATEWPIVPAPGDYDNGDFLWNEDWQGKPKCSEKTCPSAILSTTNSTWQDPGLNPGRRGGKPATYSLSYGAAIRMDQCERSKSWPVMMLITVKISFEVSADLMLGTNKSRSTVYFDVWIFSTQYIYVFHMIRRTNRSYFKYYVFGHYPSSCLYLQNRPVYFLKHNVSETGLYPRLQVKPTQLGLISGHLCQLQDAVHK